MNNQGFALNLQFKQTMETWINRVSLQGLVTTDREGNIEFQCQVYRITWEKHGVKFKNSEGRDVAVFSGKSANDLGHALSRRFPHHTMILK